MSHELPSEINIAQLRGGRREFFGFIKGIGVGLTAAVLTSKDVAAQASETPIPETNTSDNEGIGLVDEGATIGLFIGLLAGIDIGIGKDYGFAGGALGAGAGIVIGAGAGLAIGEFKKIEAS